MGKHLEGLQKNVDLWGTIRGHPTYIVVVLLFLLLKVKMWYITEITVSGFPMSLAVAFLPFRCLVVKFLMHCFHGAMENVIFKLGLITHSEKVGRSSFNSISVRM